MALIRPIPSSDTAQITLVGTASGGYDDFTKTVDCTSISGYGNLSASDFKLLASNYTARTGSGTSGQYEINFTPSATYNSSTGILTVLAGGTSTTGSVRVYADVNVYYPASAFNS